MNPAHALSQLNGISSDAYVMAIMDLCSPLSRPEIEKLCDMDTRLVQLGISDAKADSCVRRLINLKLRRTSGKCLLPPGTISGSSRLIDVLALGSV